MEVLSFRTTGNGGPSEPPSLAPDSLLFTHVLLTSPAHIHKDQKMIPDCLGFQPPALNPRKPDSLLAGQRPEEAGDRNLPTGFPYVHSS